MNIPLTTNEMRELLYKICDFCIFVQSLNIVGAYIE